MDNDDDDDDPLGHALAGTSLATLKELISKEALFFAAAPRIDRQQLSPEAPAATRFAAVMAWVVHIAGIQSHERAVNETQVARLILKKMVLNRNLFLAFKRHIKEVSDDEATLVEMEQVFQRDVFQWIRALSISRLILLQMDRVFKSAHMLSRLLWDPEDAVANARIMDDVRFNREAEMLEAFCNHQRNPQMAAEFGKAHGKGQAKDNAKELLVRHVLDIALENGYRRQGELVFEPLMITYNGKTYPTRAYRPVRWPDYDPEQPNAHRSDLTELIARACSKERSRKLWMLNIDSGVAINCMHYLRDRCVDGEFPVLRPSRNLTSYRNGIYDSKAGGDADGGTHMGRFVPYDQCATMWPGLTSSKFFDVDVPRAWFETAQAKIDGWFDIPTPLFQSVLDYQNYGEPRRAGDAGASGAPTGDAAEARVDTARVEVRRAAQAASEALEHSLQDLSAARTEQDKEAVLLSLPQLCQKLLNTVEEAVRRATSDTRSCAGAEGAQPLRGAAKPLAPPARAAGAEDATDGLLAPVIKSADLKPGLNRPEPGRELTREAQEWIYIFLGRMLHPLHLFDGWQCMPFIKGRAGTGKSLIGQVAAAFFEPHQVGFISSNMEEKFGLGPLMDKLVVICLEVKKSFKLSQADFQSMVSGEAIQVALKNRDAVSKRWSAPGLLCGNEWAAYQDSQGSIARRLAIFNFKFSVSDKDSNPDLLEDILRTELVALFIKCNIAYRQMASRTRGKGIWKILPEYFQQQRRNLQIETDPLLAAIWDTTVFEHTPVGWVSLSDFCKEYKLKWRLLKGNNFPDNLDNDKLTPALNDAKAFQEYTSREDPATPGAGKKLAMWILGLRLIRDIPDNQAVAMATAFA